MSKKNLQDKSVYTDEVLFELKESLSMDERFANDLKEVEAEIKRRKDERKN